MDLSGLVLEGAGRGGVLRSEVVKLLKKRWSLWDKKAQKAAKRREAEKRSLVRELKNTACADCGQCFSSEAMDFDHVPGRGGKLGNVSGRATLRSILNEARKCDVVCANCHRVRTERRRKDRRLVDRERRDWLDGLVGAVEREREALKAMKE